MKTAIMIIIIVVLFFQNLTLAFKIGYYEQTLENNKDKFTKERYAQIEDIKKKLHPF